MAEKESQAFFWHEKFGQALLNYYLVFGILLVIVTSVLQNCNSRYNNFTHKMSGCQSNFGVRFQFADFHINGQNNCLKLTFQ
jgi:hypothetical protein